MARKILITGGAGYVGIPLTELLLSEGYEVIVFDNLSWGGKVLLPLFKYKRFNLIEGDILNKSALEKALKGVDVVVHLAAIVGYPACRKYPKLSRRVNVTGTKNIVELAKEKTPIIFASTGSTYGKIIEEFCTESTPLRPLSNYGKQKAEAEKIIQKNKEFIIFRFATAFGISPRLRLDLLINDFTYQAVVTKTLVVYEKEFNRTFIHVRDIARAFLFALKKYNKMRNEVYNVGDEKLNMTKEEVCNIIKDRVDFYLHFVDFGKDFDQRNYIVDYSKIKKLGFRTTISIEEGIEELIKACQVIRHENPYSNV